MRVAEGESGGEEERTLGAEQVLVGDEQQVADDDRADDRVLELEAKDDVVRLRGREGGGQFCDLGRPKERSVRTMTVTSLGLNRVASAASWARGQSRSTGGLGGSGRTEDAQVVGEAAVDVDVRDDRRASVERLDAGQVRVDREGDARDRDVAGVGASRDCARSRARRYVSEVRRRRVERGDAPFAPPWRLKSTLAVLVTALKKSSNAPLLSDDRMRFRNARTRAASLPVDVSTLTDFSTGSSSKAVSMPLKSLRERGRRGGERTRASSGSAPRRFEKDEQGRT